MKKHALTIALASAMMLPSAFAVAAEGKIQFDGKITNETCSLAAKSSNIVVTMGTWSTNYFTTTNKYSELADFEITLTGCDKDGVAEFKFTGAQDGNAALLRLNNAGLASTAEGVAVGVTTGTSAAAADERVQFDGTALNFNFVKGNNTMYMKAFYEMKGTPADVKPGDAKANATFVVTYS